MAEGEGMLPPMSRPLLIPLLLGLAAAALAAHMACSSQQPRPYEQGALRPVRTPIFSPDEDAPHTFQPGQPSPVQPGPRPTRVLPETPETRRGPGIWASEEPPGEDVAPKILGVPIPFPPDAKTGADKATTYLCASLMTEQATRIIPREALIGLPGTWKPCFVAMLHRECGMLLTTNDAFSKREALSFDAVEEKRNRALLATAEALVARLCAKPLSDGEIAAITGMISRFRTHLINDMLSGGAK